MPGKTEAPTTHMSMAAAPPSSPTKTGEERAQGTEAAPAVAVVDAVAIAAPSGSGGADVVAATQRLSINQPAIPTVDSGAAVPDAPTKPKGVVHRSKGSRRRLSLLGPTGVERPRRASLLAASVQESVQAAPAESRLAVLMAAMTQEQAKLKPLLDAELVYEEPEEEEATTVVPGAPDPEMASWAMSAMNELCAGSEENRAAVAAGGGCSIILDFMAFYHNDLCVLRGACFCAAARCYALCCRHARAYVACSAVASNSLTSLTCLLRLCHPAVPPVTASGRAATRWPRSPPTSVTHCPLVSRVSTPCSRASDAPTSPSWALPLCAR